jgi:hypothetical protein
MHELSTFRLSLLRAMYLLIAVGMGGQIWPLLVASPSTPEHMRGVVWAMLGGLTLLCLLGLRYPVKMLPLLLFELAWKTIWLLAIGLPLWSSGRLDAGTSESLFACLFGVVLVPLAVPWPYVLAKYVRAPGEPWRA